MAIIESTEYTWAVLYLIGCSEDPFIKAPIVSDTVLAAQAVVGLTDNKRFINYNGSVAHGVRAQYKLFMLCGSDFFGHISNIVELANWFYSYVRTVIDPQMDRETAFALCTSILPPMTQKDTVLDVLLSPDEVKHMLNSPDRTAISFQPHPIMEMDIVKYVSNRIIYSIDLA